MLSLSQFRRHLFAVFNVLQSTGTTVEIVYKSQVYELYIRKTDKKAALTRPKWIRSKKLQAIDTTDCERCGSISFNGVCMAKCGV